MRKAIRSVYALYALAFVAALSPVAMLVGPALVMDDSYFLMSYFGSAWSEGLRPFAFDANVFWRPLATMSMSIPMARGMAGASWALELSKAISLALFAAAGLCAGWVGLRGREAAGGADRSWVGALAGLAAAAHPIFAEPSMWWSDRFDLLLCLWAPLLMGAVESAASENAAGQGDGARAGWWRSRLWIGALCAAACLSKESGFFWCAGAGALALALHGRKGLSLALSAWGAAAICAALRMAAVERLSPVFFDGGGGVAAGSWSPHVFLVNVGRDALCVLLPHLDPAPMHYVSVLEGPSLAAGGLALAGMLALGWRAVSEKRAGRIDSAMSWGWGLLAVAVVCAQAAVVSRVYPDMEDPSVWTRYAAPSAMVGLALCARAAMGRGWGAKAAAGALALALCSSAAVSAMARVGFSSEAALWCQSYEANPNERLAARCVGERLRADEPEEAKRVAERWRSANKGVESAKLDKLLPAGGAQPNR